MFRYHGNSDVLLAKSMLTIKTSKLTLADVQRHLNFQEKLEDVSFTEPLALETVSDAEKLELVQIRNDFRPYLME
ncbi:MAG: restriction endonuclease subunit R, partial [bacterium]